MDNSALSEPLLSQEHDYSGPVKHHITALSPPVTQENKAESELSNFREAIRDISTHLNKTLPASFNVPYSISEINPLSDGIHYLAQTGEGTILYLNPSARSYVSKKISASAFTLTIFEEYGVAYFERDNEILSIKIPSLEVSKFWTLPEGKTAASAYLRKIPGQKGLVMILDEEIFLLDLSDPNKSKLLFPYKCQWIWISKIGQIALHSLEDKLVIFQSLNEKIGEIQLGWYDYVNLEYSPKGSVFAIEFTSKIIIYNANNLEKLQKISKTSEKCSLSFTWDDKCLLYSDNESLIFYDLQTFEIRETISFDNFGINFIAVSINNEQVFACGTVSGFYVINFPVFDFQKSLKGCVCSDTLNESTLIAHKGDKFITWNFMTNEIIEIASVIERYSWILATNSENFIAISEEAIYKFNVPTKTTSSKFLDKNIYEPANLCCFSSDEKYMATGSKKRVLLWDFESMTLLKEFKGHDSETRAICYLSKSNALAAISNSKAIIIWDLDTTEEIATLYENDITSYMNATNSEEIIIVGTLNNCSINFWDWKKKIRLHSIKCASAFNTISVSDDDRFMIGHTEDEGYVMFVSLETFNQIFSYKVDKLYWVTPYWKGNYIKYTKFDWDTGKKIPFVKENPLKASKVTYAGPGNKYIYMNYISKLINNQEVEYNPEMDNWAIFPYMINTLHLYAYFNYPNHLKLALQNGSSMINTIFKQNTLSIAIHKGFSNCVSTIILSLDKYLQIHPYSLKSISNSALVKLNLSNCMFLLKFYEAIFRKDTSKLSAKFCNSLTEMPIHFWSKNIYIENANFFDNESLKYQEIPITFLSSHLMMDLTIGSQKSIDFLNSICNSPNPNIMNTRLIQEIIYFKWKKLRWIMDIQAILYVLYILILFVYVLYFIEESTVLAILFGISMYLSVYEAYQLCAHPISYISDIWNYIDIARSLSSILYFVISISSENSEINRSVLAFLVIISCLRGISYFRIFQNTRYMVNLISEVIKDMTSFLILLLYSTFSFAFIFLVLDEDNPKFLDYLKMSYRYDLGDFDTDGMSSVQWICFVLVTMINMIVMLNLLISIIGDTFGNVQLNSQIADTRELIGMIIELETMLMNNRKISDPCYFQMCIDSNTYNKKDKTKKLASLKKNYKTLLAKIDKFEADFDNNKEETNSKLDMLISLLEKQGEKSPEDKVNNQSEKNEQAEKNEQEEKNEENKKKEQDEKSEQGQESEHGKESKHGEETEHGEENKHSEKSEHGEESEQDEEREEGEN